ncbi:helix-turn-helix domain-containing protein [Romboutsia weinsteinii]|uniref:Helix-turn-helix domain-containing protein n=1 Tax=Romboutsia weinsteinii TaxID=2020949 RepID=A0A371IYZ4_9FIRM|nr:helix-turn-helix domain-containing protein [Romboutsia weinsteinii]RDY25701.1 helix-turn-helix domain-containing protein [Romboutsia weinsteinii]
MGIFNLKTDEAWKINYIKEFNEMRSSYENKLQKKQTEIEKLKLEIEKLINSKNTLKPKEKQITDKDISSIKKLRNDGLSYREISNKTNWSKATVSRVLNGLYD